MLVFHAGFPGRGPVEEIASVELHRGLVRRQRQGPSGLRVTHPRGPDKRPFGSAVEDPGVVVAARELDCFVVGIDAFADHGGLEEIERCSRNWGEFARGGHPRVGREVTIRVERHLVVVDARGRITAEVPVGMVDDVEHGGCLRRGLRLPDEFVLLREGVGDLDAEFAGITFLAIGAGVGEFHPTARLTGETLALPEFLAETFLAAMKGAGNTTRIVVRDEGVFLAIESKLAVGDAVAEATHGRPEVGAVRQPALEGVVSVGDVGEFSVSVRSLEGNEDGSVFRHLRLHAGDVGECPEFHLAAIGHFAVNGLGHTGAGGVGQKGAHQDQGGNEGMDLHGLNGDSTA